MSLSSNQYRTSTDYFCAGNETSMMMRMIPPPPPPSILRPPPNLPHPSTLHPPPPPMMMMHPPPPRFTILKRPTQQQQQQQQQHHQPPPSYQKNQTTANFISAALEEHGPTRVSRPRLCPLYPSVEDLRAMPLPPTAIVNSSYNIPKEHWIRESEGYSWPDGYVVSHRNLLWVLTNREFGRSITDLKQIGRCGSVVCLPAFTPLTTVKSKLRVLDIYSDPSVAFKDHRHQLQTTVSAVPIGTKTHCPSNVYPDQKNTISSTAKPGGGPSHQIVAVNANVNSTCLNMVAAKNEVPDMYSSGPNRLRLLDRFTGDLVWARRVVHPNIVSYTTSGVYSSVYYALMDGDRYGPTLRQVSRMRNAPKLSKMPGASRLTGPLDAYVVLTSVLRALYYLEAHGLVHARLDPDAIIILTQTRVLLDALHHVECAPSMTVNPYRRQLLDLKLAIESEFTDMGPNANKIQSLFSIMEFEDCKPSTLLKVVMRFISTESQWLSEPVPLPDIRVHETGNKICLDHAKITFGMRLKISMPKLSQSVLSTPECERLSLHKLPKQLYTKTKCSDSLSFYSRGDVVTYSTSDLDPWQFVGSSFSDSVLYTGCKGCSIRCVKVKAHCLNYMPMRMRHPGLLAPLSIAKNGDHHLLLLFDTTRVFTLYGCMNVAPANMSEKVFMDNVSPIVHFLAEREAEGVYPFEPEDPNLFVLVSPLHTKWSLSREPATKDTSLYSAVKVESHKWLGYLKLLHDFFVKSSESHSPFAMNILNARSLRELASCIHAPSALMINNSKHAHIPFNPVLEEPSLFEEATTSQEATTTITNTLQHQAGGPKPVDLLKNALTPTPYLF
ncbi:hypothetical protein [Crucian carp herpesvirus]|nr:hypothetical protein [Crucian carp herpesvirus]